MNPFTLLPDLCLLAIFRALPPANQLTIRSICVRWSRLALEVSQSRHSLILHLGHPRPRKFSAAIRWLTFANHNKINSQLLDMVCYFENLSTEEIHLLTSTFPRVKSLTLCIGGITKNSSIPQSIPTLLNRWAHQLTTFKLFEDDYLGAFQLNQQHLESIFSAINSMSTLTHLTLYMCHCSILPMPIFVRLQEIHCYTSGENCKRFFQQLCQHAQENQNLASMGFATDDREVDYSVLPESLRAKFTWIAHRSYQLEVPVITARFPNLVSLCLAPTADTISQLFQNLSQLKKLAYLRLDVIFCQVDDAPTSQELASVSVPSVTRFRLDLRLRLHDDLPLLRLYWPLPNVELVHIAFDYCCRCAQCSAEFFHVNQEKQNVPKNCLKKIMASLKQSCTKLRQMTHNRESAFGTVEEILA